MTSSARVTSFGGDGEPSLSASIVSWRAPALLVSLNVVLILLYGNATSLEGLSGSLCASTKSNAPPYNSSGVEIDRMSFPSGECIDFSRGMIDPGLYTFGSMPSGATECGKYQVFMPEVHKLLLTGSFDPKDPKFYKFFHKLNSVGTRTTILALGGSFTAGALCSQEFPGRGQDEILIFSQKQCSWPYRVYKWLERAFPKTNISLINRARGGTGTEAALGSISNLMKSPSEPDLIFIDFGVNDCAFDEKPPEDISQAIDQLVLLLKKTHPNTLLMSMIPMTDDCLEKPELYNMVRATYSFHQVQVLDFYTLCNVGGVCLLKQCSDHNRNVHPPYHIHQIYADFVAAALKQAIDSLRCGSRTPPSSSGTNDTSVWLGRRRPALPVCLHPVSSHDAHNNLAIHSRTKDGSKAWDIFEDRAGKPGWITSKPGAQIRFPIKFGETPSLSIEYLRSYEGLGNASVLLEGMEDKPWLLEGLWRNPEIRYSQTYTEWFYLANPFRQVDEGFDVAGTGPGWNIEPHSTHVLIFEYAGASENKFKLVAINTC